MNLSNLKSHTEKIHNFAHSNLTMSQTAMKSKYDRNTKVRKFKVEMKFLYIFLFLQLPLVISFVFLIALQSA